MGKKILTITIFLSLLVVSVFAAYWYYNKYMKKPDTAPQLAPSTDTTPAPAPVETPSTTDANVGKEAYAGVALTVYDFTGTKAKDVQAGADIGKVTGVKGTDFIIDEKYLVSMSNVITR